MSLHTDNLLPRVSRQELALTSFVWLATGGMFLLFGVGTFTAIALPYDFDAARLVALGAVLSAIGILFLRTSAPRVGTTYNHVVLVLVYVSTAAAIIAYQPYGSAALGAAMFIGPLTASRLTDRRQIAAHLAAATVCMSAPALLGIVDDSSVLAGIAAIPSLWVLGASATVVLEAAERQGEQLENLVRRDPLTGLGNRRMLVERLSEELSRHTRTSKPLSIVALDLNGFKALNDTVGHAAGDELLISVARALESTSRQEDIVARQGGDEFCLVLTETSTQAAERIAGSITAELAKIALHGMTVSTGVGIASFPVDAQNLDHLLGVADDRLRANKLSPAPLLEARSLARDPRDESLDPTPLYRPDGA